MQRISFGSMFKLCIKYLTLDTITNVFPDPAPANTKMFFLLHLTAFF